MAIPWAKLTQNSNAEVVTQASLMMKAAIVGRVGIMMLSCGTGAWRVRESMNTVARVLKIVCTADIGLVSISYSCFDKNDSVAETLTLATSGVNTDKLSAIEHFVRYFAQKGATLTVHQVHERMDKINQKSPNYTPFLLGLAAAFACSSFVFLLGGGLVEMFCSFVGAGIGNYVRAKLNQRHLTLFAGLAVAVALSCLIYLSLARGLELLFQIRGIHEAGYIGAMLFVIPGFPFITSGLDLAKLDMRSGIERFIHAFSIVMVATLIGWLLALASDLHPSNFAPLHLSVWTLLLLRIPASFAGVYGFSMLFNSAPKMAMIAALIGAVANTLRLELVDLTTWPSAVAALIGALTAGLLAAAFHEKLGYPRISLTVPAIVIMVPGLYMYRAMYYIGVGSLSIGAQCLVNALLILACLPLGLILARILLDKKWRYTN
ncbi:threonine/serine exporter family protein [Bombilactobacillus thymidiniphilus]|uniref:Threonine/serine exporter family protein n=2 Tax=Bombilactobacillus thymidiniphilus TaxID=2923363 RepID=A0ABY4PFB4_9LACO|nr:threonine/serine exporter family protein [Bombilactobacillus thymidiniphilus]UQS84340.1 threonine/serine exporter family protein [Bombilactobacillus thymidiniphilus]